MHFRFGTLFHLMAALVLVGCSTPQASAPSSTGSVWELWPEAESRLIVTLTKGLKPADVRSLLGEPLRVSPHRVDGATVVRWHYARLVLGQFAVESMNARGGHYTSYQRRRYQELLVLEFADGVLARVEIRRHPRRLTWGDSIDRTTPP